MKLYAGPAEQSGPMPRCIASAEKLRAEYTTQIEHRPAPSEVASWQNSLMALQPLLDQAELNDHGVILEYQLGNTSRRLEKAQDEVTRWVNTWFSGGHQIAGYGRDITPAQAAVGAAPMVLDAIGALVLRDLLPTEDFELLTGPWRELLAAS